MAVLDKMLSNLDSLTDAELEELLSRLEVEKSGREKYADTKGLQVQGGEIVACPCCGSVSLVKTGKKDGKQRYHCKDCGKYFTPTTNTMFHHSRLSEEQWKELLRGMVENLSLEKIADNIGTSAKTVWYNKNKILELLSDIFLDQDRFVDIAECDEYSVHLSFKGKKDPRFFVYELGRLPRHNRSRAEKIEYLQKAGLWEELQERPEFLEELLTGDCYLRGTNRDSVCILTGGDRSGNLFAKPVCVGSIETRHIQMHFDGRFEEDAIMVTDSNNSYDWFAEERNIHHEKILASKHANGPFNLARINALHSKLAAYWPDARENLPSTKYLDLNVMLFWWLEKNKGLSTKQKVEKLYSYITEYKAAELTYDMLKNRTVHLDTKGTFPNKV